MTQIQLKQIGQKYPALLHKVANYCIIRHIYKTIVAENKTKKILRKYNKRDSPQLYEDSEIIFSFKFSSCKCPTVLSLTFLIQKMFQNHIYILKLFNKIFDVLIYICNQCNNYKR